MQRLAHRRHGVDHDLPRLVVDGGEVDVLHDVAVDVVREVEVREHGAAELVDAQGHQVLAAGKGQRVDGVDHVRKRRGQGELHRRGRVQVHQRIRQGEVAHRGHARPLDEVQALDVQGIYLGQRAQHLVDHVAVVGELRPRGVELVVHAHVEAHQRRVGHAAQRHPEELPGEVGDAPAVVEEVDALRALAADVLRKARHGHGQVQQGARCAARSPGCWRGRPSARSAPGPRNTCPGNSRASPAARGCAPPPKRAWRAGRSSPRRARSRRNSSARRAMSFSPNTGEFGICVMVSTPVRRLTSTSRCSTGSCASHGSRNRPVG